MRLFRIGLQYSAAAGVCYTVIVC